MATATDVGSTTDPLTPPHDLKSNSQQPNTTKPNRGWQRQCAARPWPGNGRCSVTEEWVGSIHFTAHRNGTAGRPTVSRSRRIEAPKNIMQPRSILSLSQSFSLPAWKREFAAATAHLCAPTGCAFPSGGIPIIPHDH
jgi:hypothetical protein